MFTLFLSVNLYDHLQKHTSNMCGSLQIHMINPGSKM